ncbi:MAG: 30S ribosomal protein S17 [bacterium]
MTQEQDKKQLLRILSGKVVSNSMNKTVVVQVDRTKVHPKYQKRFKESKKYLVHDPKNSFKPGDQVSFKEIRPLSKNKRWQVIDQ